MNNTTIEARLAALEPHQIRTPNVPMAIALQDANDLARLCSTATIREALIKVGQPPTFVEDLVERVSIAREAQSHWVTVRDRTKPKSLIALEARASSLRSDLLAAGRYNLRERDELSTLSQIRGGDSIADLIQDLFDLAAVIEHHAQAFERDLSFDAQAQIGEARRLAGELSTSVSDERHDPAPSDMRELRDRAFSYLDELVTEIRSAARYAFRSSPEMAKRFLTRPRRRTRGPRGGADQEARTDEAEALDPNATP